MDHGFTHTGVSFIAQHLERIYPDENCDHIALRILDAFSLKISDRPTRHGPHWDQKETIMITYGDTLFKKGEVPLETLKNFYIRNLKDQISSIHILPFCPYTSDDGFAVSDYDMVREDLGDWSHIEEIAKHTKLMADVVINHASASHEWFKQFERGEAPGKHYIKTADPDAPLSMVVRPRPFELLRPTETKDGLKYVWCTFSHDQVDLDFCNPDVLIEFIKIMDHYISHGVRIFRLDAVAFLWKQPGTTSMHMPQTHQIIKMIRTLCRMRKENIVLITETNVPNHENLQYFGNGNEAHMIYNFSLPPLLLHALLTGRSEYLRQWMSAMPPLQNGCTYFNFTASHDGIGLRPLDGLMPEEEIDLILNTMENFGGRVTARTSREGTQKPYEINITYFDALKGTIAGEDRFQLERFIASQTIMMSLRGLPGFYIHSLLGTHNDYEKLERTKHNRSINRHQWDFENLEEMLNDDTTIHAKVFNELRRLLSIRKTCPAFHPDAMHYILQPEQGFFGIVRRSLDRDQMIYAITNLQNKPRTLSLFDLNLREDSIWIDLISETLIHNPIGELEFAPYQTVWITQNSDQDAFSSSTT